MYGRLHVSSHGRVMSLATGKELAQTPNDGGYMRVHVGERYLRVSHLVLEAFGFTRPTPRHVAAHAPDRDKGNNALTNLRWATPEENEADKAAHGTKRGGGYYPRTSARRVHIIRELTHFGVPFSVIGRIEGMHRHSVSRIARGHRHG